MDKDQNHLQPVVRSPQQHHRKMSCEEIIDEMEKEQDAAVVRLLKEVDRLKLENMQLRRQLHSNSVVSGSSNSSSRHGSQFSNEMTMALDSEYQYMLPSHRNSLSARPTVVGTPGFHPIDTSVPTQTVQRKRGASITSPRSSQISVEPSPLGNNESLIDPLQDVPRPWSVSGISGGSPPMKSTKTWQDYRIR